MTMPPRIMATTATAAIILAGTSGTVAMSVTSERRSQGCSHTAEARGLENGAS